MSGALRFISILGDCEKTRSMSFENSNAHSLPSQILAFKRLLRPSVAKVTCEQHLGICPVKALEAALAREYALLQEKDALLQEKDALLLEKDALVAEQELLRSESDHRLLNGLQMVVSLLSLQSRAAPTTEAATQLSVAASRVATIERVHRRLHFHDGTKTVALRQYLREFCQDYSTISSYDPALTLAILAEGEELEVPTAKAIPLGFIANELITNAVKYGKGRIVVGLDSSSDGRHVLSVCNDGQALPKDFDPTIFKGLGMKIIQSFIKKIGGEFRFDRGTENQGARFYVLFT
jgi:two-component sensor histidine kinase